MKNLENKILTGHYKPEKEIINFPQPIPLIDEILPVKSVTKAHLPNVLGDWIDDITERMQCPIEYVAIPALTALGSLLGRKATIYPKAQDNWHEFANVWGLVIGRPSTMKTPATNSALYPLYNFKSKAEEQHKADMIEHEVNIEKAKIEKKVNRGKAEKAVRDNSLFDFNSLVNTEDELPARKVFLLNNSTLEKLVEIHKDNPNGFMLFQDEIAGILAKVNDIDHGQELKAFLLSAWTGDQSYSTDRIGRGSTYLKNTCISLLGGTQAGKIAPFVLNAINQGFKDDGFLQRFSLMVHPDAPKNWSNIDRKPNEQAQTQAYSLFEKFKNFRENKDFPIIDPIEYRFGNEALECFTEWRTNLEHDLRNTSDLSPALESHFTKYRKLIPALSLIFELCSNFKSNDVSLSNLQKAIDLSEVLKTHAYRIYGSVIKNDSAKAKLILNKIKAGKLDNEFTARDIYKNHWSGLDKENTSRGLNQLLDYDWLISERHTSNYKPTTTYKLNPNAIEML